MSIPHSTSRWAGLKGFISPRETQRSLPSAPSTPGEDRHISPHGLIQNWSSWAGQKLRRQSIDVATVEEVHLIPGWATRHLRGLTPDDPENSSEIVLHISGFATSRQTPEFLTRSQRAFLRLARGFASIPKPQPALRPELQLEYPGLLHLPPRPYEISDDYEVETLEAHFRNSGNHEADDIHFTPHVVDPVPAELARLHENIKSRLKLFWASSLPSRRIQLSIFPQSPEPQHRRHSLKPLLTQEILTGPDGHFSGTFNIDWNGIYPHPGGMRTTSDAIRTEPIELLVEARIISTECAPEYLQTPTTTIQIPMTHSVVRVISDIDDTVKISRVLDGARAIFNQVFVKDLEDTVIPEMGEWYNTMLKCGVSFHYVSNCPFELFPVVNQFIGVSNLPRGSVRLRSYAGRSLFNGLLSAPGTRKRGNVVEVLDQFPGSQFLLVGDSGEQDLELYSSLATERPNQIAGVFIRDVCTVGLEDPTGIMVDVGSMNTPVKLKSRTTVPLPSSNESRVVPKRAASDTDISPLHPGAIRIPRPTKKGSLSGDSSSSVASLGSSLSSSSNSVRQVRPITEADKRRWDLQWRVNKARSIMPLHIVLRIFEDPKECVEAAEIIRQLVGVN